MTEPQPVSIVPRPAPRSQVLLARFRIAVALVFGVPLVLACVACGVVELLKGWG